MTNQPDPEKVRQRLRARGVVVAYEGEFDALLEQRHGDEVSWQVRELRAIAGAAEDIEARIAADERAIAEVRAAELAELEANESRLRAIERRMLEIVDDQAERDSVEDEMWRQRQGRR